MDKLITLDSIRIKEESHDDIRRLAALGYKPHDIAVSIGLLPEEVLAFSEDAERIGTTVFSLIREGILVNRALPEKALQKVAESGDVEAVKTLLKVQRVHQFERMIDDMDNDEL